MLADWEEVVVRNIPKTECLPVRMQGVVFVLPPVSHAQVVTGSIGGRHLAKKATRP